MSYQNEWLLFEAEDEFDEIKHREPTEELLFYRAVASGDIKTVKKNCERQRFTECDELLYINTPLSPHHFPVTPSPNTFAL